MFSTNSGKNGLEKTLYLGTFSRSEKMTRIGSHTISIKIDCARE